MRLTYNNVSLGDLGSLTIAGQGGRCDPPEAPVRWVSALKVRIDTTESSFAGNRVLLQDAVAALRSPKARLRWEDDDERVYLDTEATLLRHTFPDDPNAWGTYHQALEIEWEYPEQALETRNLGATWQRTGSSTVVNLGSVEKVGERTRVARYDNLHNVRESAVAELSLRGRYLGDTTLSVEARRTALLAALDQLRGQILQSATGRLRYGNIDRTVRVDGFEAEIDQADPFIWWSISVSWTEFPNADGYAQAQYRVATTVDYERGGTTRVLAGQIAADTEARALAKLTALRAAVAPTAQWEAQEQESESESVSDTLAGTPAGDGEAWIRLDFRDRYRYVTGDIIEWDLRVDDETDVRTGLLRTTYAGYVLARGASDEAAWNAAITQARALGDHKYQMRMSARESRGQSQASTIRHTVRVEFAYEYLRRGTRVFMEVRGETAKQALGVNIQRVSGRIQARSQAEAEGLLIELKQPYTGMLRGESSSWSKDALARVNLPSGTPASGFEELHTGLEFSFEVAAVKGASEIGMRYEIDVTQDFLRREKTTVLEGAVFATSAAVAETHLGTFIAGLGLGSPVRNQRRTSTERGPNPAGITQDAFVQLAFSETFVSELTGNDQILETELTEEIRCSGARRVVAPTATGSDIIQTCGVESGRRTVSGSVTALTETTALAWARRQRNLPYLSPDPALRYAAPSECRIQHVTVPMKDPVARSGTYGNSGVYERQNVSAVRVNFSFTDLLPLYDPLA